MFAKFRVGLFMNYKINQKYFFTIILSFITVIVSSQEVYITNGITFSSAGEGINHSQKSYQINLGLNYIKNEWYFLSSNIGFTHKGGCFYKEIINNEEYFTRKIDEFSYNYFSIETLFNVKKCLK